MLKQKVGFTLAEVLITLGIIGVVAALTIPALLNDAHKKDTYVAMQKAYSVLSQAAAQVRSDNGNSMADVATSSSSLADIFSPFFKTVQICPDSTTSANCYIQNTDPIYNLQGGLYGGVTNYLTSRAKFNTSDGFVYIFYLPSPSCVGAQYQRAGVNEYCGTISVDINGVKRPNTFGKDLFVFSLNKYNLTPYDDMSSSAANCDPLGVNPFNGAECSSKAILNGEINYY